MATTALASSPDAARMAFLASAQQDFRRKGSMATPTGAGPSLAISDRGALQRTASLRRRRSGGKVMRPTDEATRASRVALQDELLALATGPPPPAPAPLAEIASPRASEVDALRAMMRAQGGKGSSRRVLQLQAAAGSRRALLNAMLEVRACARACVHACGRAGGP